MSRNRVTASYCFWVCFVLLLVLAIVRTSQSQVVGKNGELINCMKYPFAPRCRGISAKRSPFYMGQPPPNSIPDESVEDYDTKRNNINRKRSQFMRAIPMSYEDFIAGMKRSF